MGPCAPAGPDGGVTAPGRGTAPFGRVGAASAAGLFVVRLVTAGPDGRPSPRSVVAGVLPRSASAGLVTERCTEAGVVGAGV
ncbi:hypothetical protein GCM10010303_68660 [Streptomyces purpurascens]|nr:hypothetical protein GCM10010303_68660 [Streptomyces purpurascens]